MQANFCPCYVAVGSGSALPSLHNMKWAHRFPQAAREQAGGSSISIKLVACCPWDRKPCVTATQCPQTTAFPLVLMQDHSPSHGQSTFRAT